MMRFALATIVSLMLMVAPARAQPALGEDQPAAAELGGGQASPESRVSKSTPEKPGARWAEILVTAAVSAAIAAFVSGLFLLGGFYYSRRLERTRDEERLWQQFGMPVINAADDLVARIFDVIVRGRTLGLDQPIPSSIESVYDPPKSISTVWRLINYLAASTYLEQHVADPGPTSKTSILRFYTHNKARVPLKGNMYGATSRLQTEGQQLIGSKVLSLSSDREVRDVDFFRFLQHLKTDEELKQSVDACRRSLCFDSDLQELDGQFLTVAHFVVHLIDTVQDLRPSSKWEEFRIFLVSLLRSYNSRSAKRRSFLYQRDDLAGTDYLATYSILPTENGSAEKRKKRLEARARSGFSRQISSEGITRTQGRETVVFKYTDSPGDLLQKLRSVFT